MLRELFTIPGLNFPIFGYGLMLVVACICAIQLAKSLARRCGLNPEHFVNIGLLALLSGIVGARLVHVLSNWGNYTAGSIGENLWHMVNIREGGLVYYGGFLFATPVCIAYGLWNRLPILRGMDIIAPCLMIGLGLGRVGCYLNGCCWGGTCTLPWAVQFPYGSPPLEDQATMANPAPKGQVHVDPKFWMTQTYDITGARWLPITPRLRTPAELNTPELRQEAAHVHSLPLHPVQLYSTITAMLIAAGCVAYFTTRPRPGRVFALMLLLEGFGRFTLENLRTEPAVVHFGSFAWSFSMVTGASLIVAGAALMPLLALRKRPATATVASGTTA